MFNVIFVLEINCVHVNTITKTFRFFFVCRRIRKVRRARYTAPFEFRKLRELYDHIAGQPNNERRDHLLGVNQRGRQLRRRGNVQIQDLPHLHVEIR